MKSHTVSFEEMHELALHFAAYYDWPKALIRLTDEAEAVRLGMTPPFGLPDGGYKQSGFGRTDGVDRLNEFLQIKNIRIGMS